jgi:RNA polymerase sigma-70 factor (ECF subfamily)
MMHSDEDLARLVQQGNAEGFGELIRRYEPKLLRYAKKFLFTTEDSKDHVQDVFLKAYMNIKSFDAARRFSPWLYRIAHNEFVNAIRKNSRLPVFSFDLDVLLPHPAAKETSEDAITRREMKELLDRSLGALSPKYRELLVLYYFEEMDYKEIAEILRIPVGTVGVRLARGREQLKKNLQAQEKTQG